MIMYCCYFGVQIRSKERSALDSVEKELRAYQQAREQEQRREEEAREREEAAVRREEEAREKVGTSWCIF